MRYASTADRDHALRFFLDRPVAQALFEQVVNYVDTLGELPLVATRSRVAFAGRTRFLWAHGATRDGLWLGFLLPEEVASPRLRSGPVGQRFSHHVKLTGPLDEQLKGWLAAAFRADAAG